MTKKTEITLACSAERATDLCSEIGKVRCWITGFEAAGKAGPPGEESLRQIQVLLKDAINHSKAVREHG